MIRLPAGDRATRPAERVVPTGRAATGGRPARRVPPGGTRPEAADGTGARPTARAGRPADRPGQAPVRTRGAGSSTATRPIRAR